MLSLDQVRALEERVERAIAAIDRLSAENAALRGELEAARTREGELERTIEDFRRDQERIEAGIVSALRKLDVLEDAALRPRGTVPAGTVNAGAAAPVAPAAGDSEAEAAAGEDIPADARGVVLDPPSDASSEAQGSEASSAELDIF
ncbi:MAG: cell division protein ZapB [Spirochaetales bacterium]|nr:cell division protein ZapB [Spirochaetales bacterium]